MSDALDGGGLYQDSPGMMRLISGHRMSPIDAMPKDIQPEDIAHALARQCRYNGHVGGYLSVARHSMWVADRVEALGGSYDEITQGLLHDAAEAYLGDIIRPLKHATFGTLYREVEEKLERVIAQRFGLHYPFSPLVHEADNWVLLNCELPEPNGARWTWDTTPAQDKDGWLALYKEYAL